MRRMYSEQELSRIIKVVFEEELADGALDDLVSDAVDAYLVENPVDITALEGQDISLATLTSTGNVDVGGDLDVTGSISGAEIIEQMSGYSASVGSDSVDEFNPIYVSVCKNGNKLTFVAFGEYTRLSTTASSPTLIEFFIPSNIHDKLFPSDYGGYNRLYVGKVFCAIDQFSGSEIYLNVLKLSNNRVTFDIRGLSALTQDQKYMLRAEVTFLLNDSLIS